jgi:hypothetical protein
MVLYKDVGRCEGIWCCKADEGIAFDGYLPAYSGSRN